MHNIKDIRQNPDQFKKDLSNRFTDIDLKKILFLDESNRKLIQKKESLEKEKKDISKTKDPSSFESGGLITNLPIQLEAKVNEYLSLVMKLIFAFGLSFQLPVVLSLLARIGVVDSEFLRSRRKYVIVIIFAAAAILTPPDPITQIGLAIPLLILYELSILSVSIIEKKSKENAQH